MWQEARKQEKKLRGMMVDHKRRAERRREYYEKIKQDPTQFLQVHGRPGKIHLDPAVSAAADAPSTMMPWQGNKEISIDRFDVRAHLDFIAESHDVVVDPENDSRRENRETNYERYRILIQNDFLRVPEEKFLRTIELEEKFGSKTYQSQKAKDDKKKSEKSKAAIGFVYQDSTEQARPVPDSLKSTSGPLFPDPRSKGNEGEDESDSDIDLDMTVDIMALGHTSQKEINKVGKDYNLGKEDFIKYLARDIEEQQELRAARQQEEEKAMFSGRKSRRERRMIRERRLMARRISPPSYATRSSPSYDDCRKSGSRSNSSRSCSPEKPGKVEFITSFGGESEEESSAVVVERSSMSSESKSKLKRLRKEAREDRPIVMGPTFPPHNLRRSSSSERKNQRHRRPRSSRSSSVHRRWRRSRSRDGGDSRHRGGQRREGRERRSRSREKRRRSRSRSKLKTKPAKRRQSTDSSSSDSSSDQKTKSTRYRSKYRNRRRSSSLSSGQDANESLGENRKPLGSSGNGVKIDPLSPPNERPIMPEAPVKRYYDRIREHVKSDDESDLTEEDNGNVNTANEELHGENIVETKDSHSANKVSQQKEQDGPSNNVKDKIRRRVQAQIKRQFKIDKLAEEERRRKIEEERLFREEEMRELALKLRKKDRERRHRNYGSNSSDEDGENCEVSPRQQHDFPVEPRRRSGSPSERRESRRDRSRSLQSPKRSRSKSRHSPKRKRRSRSRSRESPSPVTRPRLVDY